MEASVIVVDYGVVLQSFPIGDFSRRGIPGYKYNATNHARTTPINGRDALATFAEVYIMAKLAQGVER